MLTERTENDDFDNDNNTKERERQQRIHQRGQRTTTKMTTPQKRVKDNNNAQERGRE